ncbi:hypothetical protein ACFQJ5_01075 [Halomicroarcula sp. GCM10025324]|uniref:hypothetical protein n=1 Tax=Haloarcula TaxID=2237 RepID=UPI0023E7BDF7|nr:hypothetical protein [Halomicroarcula sp. ZS-22-S1]
MTGIADDPARNTDVDRAIAAVRTRGETVRADQLDRALSELDAERLTDAQREAIERLSDRLVDQLLAVPERRLRRLAADGDDAAVERALALFGSDGR